MKRGILAIIIPLVLFLSACSTETSGDIESVPAADSSAVTEKSSTETIWAEEEGYASSVETVKFTEVLTTYKEQEICYLPFTQDDAYNTSRKGEHGFDGYGFYLGSIFKDEGQWNAYQVYPWGQEDYENARPYPQALEIVSWMEELGLVVLYDYPYCSYYVDVNGKPEQSEDWDNYQAVCVVVSQESIIAELFGKDSPSIHGFYFRVIPAMDPALPFPSWYDQDRLYYYRGIAINPDN